MNINTPTSKTSEDLQPSYPKPMAPHWHAVQSGIPQEVNHDRDDG